MGINSNKIVDVDTSGNKQEIYLMKIDKEGNVKENTEKTEKSEKSEKNKSSSLLTDYTHETPYSLLRSLSYWNKE